MMLEKCRAPIKEAMNSIAGCFAGVDGGISYAKLCILVECLDCKAQEGGTAQAEVADKIVSVVLDFNRLITVAKERV